MENFGRPQQERDRIGETRVCAMATTPPSPTGQLSKPRGQVTPHDYLSVGPCRMGRFRDWDSHLRAQPSCFWNGPAWRPAPRSAQGRSPFMALGDRGGGGSSARRVGGPDSLALPGLVLSREGDRQLVRLLLQKKQQLLRVGNKDAL